MTPWIPSRPTHVITIGQTRSGKTTSTGRQLLRRWVTPREPPRQGFWDRVRGSPLELARAPPGFIGQCVKVGEGEDLCQMLERCGRGDQIVRVTADPACPWRGDPLSIYFGLRGASIAGATDLVSRLAVLVERFDRSAGEAFWKQSAARLLYMSLAVLAAAYERPTFAQLYAILSSLPTPEAVSSGAHQGSFCRRAVMAAQDRRGGTFPREFDTAFAYLSGEWMSLPEKTRESIRPHALNLAFPFVQAPINRLCEGPQTLTPEMLDDGACIVLDVPVLRYQQPALLWQAAMKTVFDLYILDRPAGGREVLAWSDEYQWLCLPDWDLRVQTVAAESGYFSVKMFQTISVLIEAIGGQKAEHWVNGLIANAPLVVWHAVSNCPVTMDAASKRCGDYKEMMYGGSSGGQPYDLWADMNGTLPPTAQSSWHEAYNPRVRGHELAGLKTGGPQHGWVCGALITRTGHTHAWVDVPQVIFNRRGG